MNARERVIRALNHTEPDRVPFDLGGKVETANHVKAYQNQRNFLALLEKDMSKSSSLATGVFVLFSLT